MFLEHSLFSGIPTNPGEASLLLWKAALSEN